MESNVNDLSLHLHDAQGGNAAIQITLSRMWEMAHAKFKKLRELNEGGETKTLRISNQMVGIE